MRCAFRSKSRIRGGCILVGAWLVATMSTLFAEDPPTPVPSGATLPANKAVSDSALAMNFPDKFAWTLFVQVNQKAKQQVPVGGKTTNNAVWETWADDPWTFPKNPDPANPPKWPEGAEPGKRLIKGAASGVHRVKLPDQGVDASGSGGEEVHRNKATFDYIIKHNLWYQEGIAAFFAKAAKAKDPTAQTRAAVNFPIDAIEVKGNWVAIDEKDKAKYHWNYNEDGKLYGLVAMHISSKALPNWFWSTFEWVDNPGRCDYIGCHDAFGVEPHHVPSRTDKLNQTYPAEKLTPELLDLFAKNGFTAEWGDEWKHYRLKGSQTDFTDSTGRALLLGNSVTEAGFVPSASCITCHGRAAVNSQGQVAFPIFGEKHLLPLTSIPQQGASANQNPTAITYNGVPDPSWYYKFDGNGSTLVNLQVDFVWAIPFKAQPAKKTAEPKK